MVRRKKAADKPQPFRKTNTLVPQNPTTTPGDLDIPRTGASASACAGASASACAGACTGACTGASASACTGASASACTGARACFAARGGGDRCAGDDRFLGCIQGADQRFLLDSHVGLLGFFFRSSDYRRSLPLEHELYQTRSQYMRAPMSMLLGGLARDRYAFEPCRERGEELTMVNY